MRRRPLCALLGCLLVAGCLGVSGVGSPTATPAEPTATPTGTATATPTATPPETPRPTRAVASYAVHPGPVAEGVAHVYVAFALYLAERPEDVHACTDDAPLMDNRYDPTPTPLPTPAGECRRVDAERVDLAALEGPRTLVRVETAGETAAHSLVVHDVTVVLENGTTARRVHDTDFRAMTERQPPNGSYAVELGVVDRGSAGPDWRFEVTVEQVTTGG